MKHGLKNKRKRDESSDEKLDKTIDNRKSKQFKSASITAALRAFDYFSVKRAIDDAYVNNPKCDLEGVLWLVLEALQEQPYNSVTRKVPKKNSMFFHSVVYHLLELGCQPTQEHIDRAIEIKESDYKHWWYQLDMWEIRDRHVADYADRPAFEMLGGNKVIQMLEQGPQYYINNEAALFEEDQIDMMLDLQSPRDSIEPPGFFKALFGYIYGTGPKKERMKSYFEKLPEELIHKIGDKLPYKPYR